MTNKMIMQEQLEEVLLIMAEKGLIPYKDGNAWCILLGENIQEGICGFGYTIIDAMMDFYREASAEGVIRKEEQKSVKDKIIEDTISYLNGGMCFSNSMEELKYRSNLAYGLKSLRPQSHTVSKNDAIKFGNLEYERGVKDGIQSEKSRHWKPSEEHFQGLRRAITKAEKGSDAWNFLTDLYEQLEKL